MIRNRPTTPGARAFTLVELLVVGALIAIFAGLAIINVQQQYESNQRKAVIGESRQVAAAMDFAYNDIGMFPKIAFLQYSIEGLRLESQRLYGNSAAIFSDFNIYGIGTSTAAANIQEDWLGPYFSASQSRSRVAQGRGGSRFMQTDIMGGSGTGISWPVDAYNNPYMYYGLHVDEADGSLYFTTGEEDDPSVQSTNPRQTGNRINAIVSYGRNRVPGGGNLAEPAGSFDDSGVGTAYGLRLYRGNPDNEQAPLVLLQRSDLFGSNGQRRANVWGVGFATDTTGFALDNDGINPVGITDPGSDDIVFTF